MEYVNEIQALIASNPVLTGIFGASFLTGMVVWARNVPRRIWHILVYHFTVTMEVANTDDAFPWVLLWISKTRYSKKARSLSITTQAALGSEDTDRYGDPYDSSSSTRRDIVSVPGNGWAVTFIGWRPFFVTRIRDTAKSNELRKPFEAIKLTTIGRSQKSANLVIDQIRKSVEEKLTGKTRIYIPRRHNNTYHGDWVSFERLAKRDKDSVILRNGIMDSLVSDVKKFLAARETYERYGIPYHRGYLFYGKPGNGKSSAATAIAGEIGWSICIMSMSGVGDDDTLRMLFSTVPDESIVLIEDIDAAFDKRDNKDGITFSGLLNVIDGVGAKHGQIVIMTTNHKEKLDPALIRSGRADVQVEFENACRDTADMFYRRFNPKASQEDIDKFVEEMTDKPMASLQERLMANIL